MKIPRIGMAAKRRGSHCSTRARHWHSSRNFHLIPLNHHFAFSQSDDLTDERAKKRRKKARKKIDFNQISYHFNKRSAIWNLFENFCLAFSSFGSGLLLGRCHSDREHKPLIVAGSLSHWFLANRLPHRTISLAYDTIGDEFNLKRPSHSWKQFALRWDQNWKKRETELEIENLFATNPQRAFHIEIVRALWNEISKIFIEFWETIEAFVCNHLTGNINWVLKIEHWMATGNDIAGVYLSFCLCLCTHTRAHTDVIVMSIPHQHQSLPKGLLRICLSDFFLLLIRFQFSSFKTLQWTWIPPLSANRTGISL